MLGLFRFIQAAIEGRERGKFIFTRNLSEILRIIKKRGAGFGYKMTDLSHLNIKDLQNLYDSTQEEGSVWQWSIERGRQAWKEGEGLLLPPLILSADDVEAFHLPDEQPTFITLGKTEGAVCVLTGDKEESLEGKIVLIPSADPGFDWIFSHHIKGFITAWGGANSHMAIRAGELNLPAVIGTGQKLFNQLQRAKRIEIDAALKKVRVIR